MQRREFLRLLMLSGAGLVLPRELGAIRLETVIDCTETFFNKNSDDLYLSMRVNINCVDDRYKISGIFKGLEFVEYGGLDVYLGKITFKKNKNGLQIPQFTPNKINNQILDKEIDKLKSPLWLDEINPNYTKPFDMKDFNKQFKELMKIYSKATDVPVVTTDVINQAFIDRFKNNFNLLHKRSPKNITLNKEQIISYITECHSKNVALIKDYIDSINQYKGD